MAKSAKELFSDITFIFKIVELALAIAGMAVMIGKGTSYCITSNGEFILFNMAFTAYVIIMFILILTIIFDEVSQFCVLGFLIVGFIMNLATAIVAIINYTNVPSGHGGGGSCLMLMIFAIALCVIMLVDIIFTFKK